MSDAFLDDLTDDLKPVRPLRIWPLWLGAGIGFVLAGLYVAHFYDLRLELKVLGLEGAPWLAMPIFKPLIFLITGACALWAVARLARPEGRLSAWTLAPVAVMAATVVIAMLLDLGRTGIQGAAEGLNGGADLCYMTILCGGMAGLIVLWRFWLRHTATSHPITLGAMSGLATASVMAAAYSLHCNMDAPVYLLLVYGLAVTVLTGCAAVLGSRVLRW